MSPSPRPLSDPAAPVASPPRPRLAHVPAPAEVCQEAGARAGRNVALKIGHEPRSAHSAPRSYTTASRSGTVDVTLVSPLSRDGPRHRDHARRCCARSCQPQAQANPRELDHGRWCRLVVFGLEVGGRWDAETASFLRLLARARAFATQAVLHRQPGCSDGVASLLLLRSGRNHAAPKIRIACLRSEMRGVPAGPSGATNEHLHILLDDEGDTQLLHRAACRLARADLPPPFLAVLRVGSSP